MSDRGGLSSVGRGLFATVATVFVAELLVHFSIHTPNLSVMLLVTVLYATFADGFRYGVGAGALALSFYAVYVSTPGALFHYTPDDLERVVITGGAMGLGVTLVGSLRQRVERLLSRERVLQTEAQATSARMLELVESITDGFFAVDREWRYTYVNLKAEELVKTPRASLLGKTIWEAFPELVGSRWDHEYRRALAEGITVRFEEYYAPLEAWFETRAYPSPAGLTIYLTDITTKKRAEQDLASRLGQQAAIAALGLTALRADDPSKIVDEAVRVIASELDVELAKVLELSPDEGSLLLRSGVGWNEGAVGSSIDTGIGSQAGYTLATDAPVVVEDLRSESRFHGPTLLLDHGVVSGMSVVIVGEGRPFGVLGVHTRRLRRFTRYDVTFLQAVANVVAHAMQRKNAEENARRLQQEQLARATAEAGLRARDDVLALVSHDLRSPLNTIVMSVELLREQTGDQACLKRLGGIGRAAVRMSRLVDDLLDVARIEAGKMSLRIAPVEVSSLFEEAREVLEVQALEKSVRLELHCPPGLPPVAADRDRMLRVVLNLVGNAIKFTPPGGLVVLGAEVSDACVVVSVSDSGPGIPDRDRPQLFRPFWQANGSDGRGAGLGLSIARGIVEAHQGQIWISDASQGGARFSFSLSPAPRGSQVS